MSDREQLTAHDLLHLHGFKMFSPWALSRDGALLALAITRPLTKTITHTNGTGGQAEERDIFWADLSAKEPKLAPLIPPDSGVLSFAPAWSPDGKLLAFVRCELEMQEGRFGVQMPQWRGFLSLWRRDTGEITDLAPIILNAIGDHLQVPRWVGERLLLGFHHAAPERRLSGQWSRMEADLGARFHQIDTAVVYDTDLPTPTPGYSGTLSLFEIGASAAPLWQMDGIEENFSLGSRVCLAQRGSAEAAKLMRLSLDGTTPAVSLDTANWKWALDNLAFDRRSGAAWALWEDDKNDGAGLVTMDPQSDRFRQVGSQRFQSVTALHVCANGSVLFRAKQGTGPVQWHIQLPGAAEAVVLEGSDAMGAGQIFELASGLFISETGHTFSLSGAALKPLNPDESGGEPFQIAWPKPENIQQWQKRKHPRHADICIRSTEPGKPSRWMATRNGSNWSLLDLPKEAQIKAVAGSSLAFLVQDATGSHVDVLQKDGLRRIASFNKEMARKKHPLLKFFRAASDPKEGITERLCGLILPPTPPPPGGFPVLAHIYPHSQYRAHMDEFFHSCNYPHAHNEHLAAASGFAVLMVAMPLSDETVQQGQEAVLDAAAMNLELALQSAEGINRDRVVIMGHSWGGGLVVNMAVRNPRLRGVIASSGIYNPLADYGRFENRELCALDGPQEQESMQTSMMTIFTNDAPWENLAAYTANAAMLNAPRLETPILILHGERDFLPVSEAEQLYAVLKATKKSARFVSFAGEGHIISSPQNILRFHEEILRFLEKCFR
jgi:acetyl esterase/lipase